MAKKSPIKVLPEFFNKFPKDQWTPEIAQLAVEKTTWNLRWIPRKLLTKDICQLAIFTGDIQYVPKKFMTRNDYLTAVKANSESLKYVPERFLTKDFYVEVIKHSPFILHQLPPELVTQEICNTAFEANPHATYISIPAKFKTEEMSEEVMIYGTRLPTVPEALRTERICKLALWREPQFNLSYFPEKFVTQKICNYAVARNWEAIKEVPEKYKTFQLCLEALRQSNKAKQFIPQKFIDAGIESWLDFKNKPNNQEVACTNPHRGYAPISPMNIVEYSKDDTLFQVDIEEDLSEEDIEIEIEEKEEEATPKNKSATVYMLPPVYDPTDPEIKKFIPKDTDPEIVETLVSLTKDIEGVSLGDVPKSLRSKGLCENMVRIWGKDLQYVPEEYKTRELCRLAIEDDGEAISYVPPELVTEELCILAIKSNPEALASIPEESRTLKMCKLAVKGSAGMIALVPEKFLTPSIAKLAFASDPDLFDVIPDNVKTLALCKEAVKKSAYAMSSVPEVFKTKEFCQYAIRCHGSNLKGVPEKLKTLELCQEALIVGPNTPKNYGEWRMIFEAIPEKYRTKELFSLALERTPEAYEFLPDNMKTLDLCLQSIIWNGGNIMKVPKEMRKAVIDALGEKISAEIDLLNEQVENSVQGRNS